ncbi:MAG: ferrochelatase [Novosphingobium sp.]
MNDAERTAAPGTRPGILLVNLGTPDAPTPEAVRRYLAEFLSDRRVVDLPPLLWQPILRGIILRTRPKKSAHAYAQVWTEQGSPLAAITRAQARALQELLGENVPVTWAMRYGKPAIAASLMELRERGCERILFAPLYPQYSVATTTSAIDGLEAALAGMADRPKVRILPAYYEDPLYIAALRDDVARQLVALPFAPQVLLLSFHGMPERTRLKGDPYYGHCLATARLLGEALQRDVPSLRIEISFQSRFGPAKWLSPATDDTLRALAKQGVERLAVAAPGFSADCLETREELAIRGSEQFLGAGGREFAALDCLNDSAAGMAMLEGLMRQALNGWT